MTEKGKMERINANIPSSLKRRVQMRAVAAGKSLTDVVIEALSDWLDKQEGKKNGHEETLAEYELLIA